VRKATQKLLVFLVVPLVISASSHFNLRYTNTNLSASANKYGWYVAWRLRLLIVHPSGSEAAKSARLFDMAAFDLLPLFEEEDDDDDDDEEGAPRAPNTPPLPPCFLKALNTLLLAAAARSAAASSIKSRVVASYYKMQ